MGLSLLLHAAVFGVVLLLSLKSSVDRPIGAAVQVSLVSLPPAPKPVQTQPKPAPVQKAAPAPQPKVEAPPVDVPKPVTLPVPPAKSPAVASAPAPAPKAAPAPARAPLPPEPSSMASSAMPSIPKSKSLPPPPSISESRAARATPAPLLPPQPTVNPTKPSRQVDNPFRGALKDIDLPREAPKLGELSPERPKARRKPSAVASAPVPPQRASERTQQDVQELLDQLKVPEQRRVTLPTPPADPRREAWQNNPMREELSREQERLQEELQRVRQTAPDIPRASKFETAEVKTADVRPTPPPAREEQAAPVATAAVSSTSPDVNIQVQGAGGAMDSYFTQVVQPRIASHWDGTQIDMPPGAAVVIGLRLARDGTITKVDLKRSSGNDYYDMAALRAVRATHRVPPVPKHLTKPYYDIDYSFAFKGQTG